MNIISICLLVVSFTSLTQLCQSQQSNRWFIVHSEPDCSDYGQIDTVGEEFMFAHLWLSFPLDLCYYIPDQHDRRTLWATFMYITSPNYSESRLQWFYPAAYCQTGTYENTMVVTYDISVNAPSITCVPTYMTEVHSNHNTSKLVYVTINEPPIIESSSTGTIDPMPEPDDPNNQSTGLSPIATCLIIGFTIVGFLAIAAACYVWRWRQLQTWEQANQQRLMSSRFGVS